MTHTVAPLSAPDVYDPNHLLNTIKQRLHLDSDNALSRKLKVGGNLINDIREGRLPVGGSMLLWMQEASGIGIDELRRLMGDRRGKSRLRFSIASSAPA